MADVTITGLPNASTLTGAERVPMDQSGTTVDAAASAIAALATKTTVGLGNCDNTSDANKPISTATQTALDGKAAVGPIGSSGVTMTAGVLGRESGTGAPQTYALGSGLSIVNGALTVTAGGSGTVTSVAASVPTGFSVAGSPITTTGTLAITFAAGYSLPTDTRQGDWDTAFVQRRQWDGSSQHLDAVAGRASLELGTAAQAATTDFATAAQGTDAREWSAATVTQAEAEAGTSTSRRAFTAQRVFQAVAAYIAANFSAVGRALATAASAAAARDTLELGTAATAASGDFLPTTFTAGTITYAAQVTLDMSALAGEYRTISLTGNLEFLTSNRASGRQVTIRLICDATQRALTFPAGWVFIGTKPSTIAASKTAVLSLTFFGTADTDCVAAYGVQS